MESDNEEVGFQIQMGIIKAIWVLWYGTARTKNEMETIAMVLLALKKEPLTTNPYWTLSDLNEYIKKTYADIQQSVWYLEENKLIKTGKDWVKNQGNRRYIKLTFSGSDFLGTCNMLANKNMKELEEKGFKRKESSLSE